MTRLISCSFAALFALLTVSCAGKTLGDQGNPDSGDEAHAVTATGLRVGEVAPDFSLTDRAGASWSLAEARASGPVVVIFYRGHWCPKCRGQLDRIQARLGEIEGKGARLVAVSVDPVEDTNKLAERHGYTFPMLRDPDLATIRAYGVEDVGHDISKPATFVVGADGTIVFVYVGDAPGDRPAEDMSIAAIP